MLYLEKGDLLCEIKLKIDRSLTAFSDPYVKPPISSSLKLRAEDFLRAEIRTQKNTDIFTLQSFDSILTEKLCFHSVFMVTDWLLLHVSHHCNNHLF